MDPGPAALRERGSSSRRAAGGRGKAMPARQANTTIPVVPAGRKGE